MKVWLTKLSLIFLCSCAVGFSVTRNAEAVTVTSKTDGNVVIASSMTIKSYEPKTCSLEPTIANGKDTLLICPSPIVVNLFTAGVVSAQAFSPSGFPLTPPTIR